MCVHVCVRASVYMCMQFALSIFHSHVSDEPFLFFLLFSLKVVDDHYTDCRRVTDYTLEYGRQFADGTSSWTSDVLPADTTAHTVVNMDPGDYVVRLTVTNAGGERNFHETKHSVKSSSASGRSVNTGLVAGVLVFILVILAL